jgi:hypothetical protein
MADDKLFDINTVSKFIEPINKLIDAVSKAVGSLNDPEMIKARAKAKAAAKRTKVESGRNGQAL